jgi:hypothetical protein
MSNFFKIIPTHLLINKLKNFTEKTSDLDLFAFKRAANEIVFRNINPLSLDTQLCLLIFELTEKQINEKFIKPFNYLFSAIQRNDHLYEELWNYFREIIDKSNLFIENEKNKTTGEIILNNKENFIKAYLNYIENLENKSKL